MANCAITLAACIFICYGKGSWGQQFEADFEIINVEEYKNLNLLKLEQPNATANISSFLPPTSFWLSLELAEKKPDENISAYLNVIQVFQIVPTQPPPQCLASNGSNLKRDEFCVLVADDKKCKVCVPGFALDNQTCTPCQAGFFKKDYGIDACNACQAGWSTMGLEGQISCWACEVGFSTMGLAGQPTCIQCVPNSQALNIGTPSCSCILGTMLDYSGSQCVPCVQGTYRGIESPSHCMACPAGKNAPHAASTTCFQCQNGTYAPIPGLDQCILCPPNTTSSTTSASCEPCPPQTYTLQPGALFCMCLAGTTMIDALNRCQMCNPGSYQQYNEDSNNSLVCQLCKPGTYSANQGQSQCKECPQGKYEEGLGSTDCQTCGAHFVSKNPRTNAADCLCMAGSALDFQGVDCVLCPSGFYQVNEGAADCISCPAFRTNIAVGSTDCDICMSGTAAISTTNQTTTIECKQCRPGFYQQYTQQTQCLQCPAGTFSNMAGSTYCRLCAQDSFASIGGSSECSPCPAYSETGGVFGSTRCACALGSSISISDTCLPCAAGFFQAERGGACRACTAGTYTPTAGLSGALACLLCKQGTFAPIAGLSSCQECSALSNTTSAGATSCICNIGTSSFDPIALVCRPCTPGFYQAPPTTRCTQCQMGSYSNESQASSCKQCPTGTHSPSAASTVCWECQGNSIPSPNQTFCTCAPTTFNQTSSNGSWKCSNCTQSCDYPTSYLAQECNSNQDTVCKVCSTECPTGKYITDNCTKTQDITCQSCSLTCAIGYYIKTNCTPTQNIICAKCSSKCPSKRYAAWEACTHSQDLKCILCAPGTYAKDNYCAECLPGSISSNLDDVCIACGRGLLSNANKTACLQLCEPNTYPSSPKGCSVCPSETKGNGMGCYQETSSQASEATATCKPNFIFNINASSF